VLVDKPGTPQTQLRAVSIAAPRVTPDFEAMVVANDILGGLFTSRINLNLREAHGYTYGANSQFVFRRSPGFFVVATGVRTDVTAPALSEIVKELGKIRDGVTGEELTLARDAEMRSLPSEFETSSNVTTTSANLFLFGLPLDHYAKAQARYAALTAEQVNAAARKYIAPDKTLFIIVGDRAKIGAELEKLNLGPIEIWNADGTKAGN
jgi:zinc protease